MKLLLTSILLAVTLAVVFPKTVMIWIFTIGTLIGMIAQGQNPFPN